MPARDTVRCAACGDRVLHADTISYLKRILCWSCWDRFCRTGRWPQRRRGAAR